MAVVGGGEVDKTSTPGLAFHGRRRYVGDDGSR